MCDLTFVFSNGPSLDDIVACPPAGTYKNPPNKTLKLGKNEELSAITFGIHHFNGKADIFGLCNMALTSMTN